MTKPNEEILNRLENHLSAPEAMQVLTICNEYFNSQKRELKLKSVRSYCKIVNEMREAQKRYFQTKSKDALNQAIKLEKQVDDILSKALK